MSLPIEDPLSIAPDDTNQSLRNSTLCHSVNDANENVVKSKSMHEKISGPEKIYDFLVWNHECNSEEASRIYEEMEKSGFRGYNYERDKIAGKYKQTAISQAIQSTANIILLISMKALKCSDFRGKMHLSSNYSVIPVYIDVPRKEYPRLLRHHVDIQYKNSDFWLRLHTAITRPRKDSNSTMEVGNLSKPMKKESNSSQASLLSRRAVKPIKMVPGKSTAPEKQHKKSPPSSKTKPEKKGWFLLFRSKQNREKEMPSIPMKTIRTRREVLDDDHANNE